MRKRGAKHSTQAVIPLNAKSTRNEFKVRAGLLALAAGFATEQHVVDLYVMADLCEALNTGNLPHIETHCRSVKRLCNDLKTRSYQASTMQAMAMTASIDVLIAWFDKLPNKRVADVARGKLRAAQGEQNGTMQDLQALASPRQ